MPPLLEAHLRAHESPVSPYESLSPFFATDPQNAPITPFLATLPKSLDFNSFRCHTSEPPRGARHKLLTRNLAAEFLPASCERCPRVSPPSAFFHRVRTGYALPSNPTTPLSFHALTNCKFSNSFVLKFIQTAGGMYPPSPLFPRFQSSSAATASQRPEAFFFLHTINCQLSTVDQSLSHQSPVTSHEP